LIGVGDIEAQTRHVFHVISDILLAAGSSLGGVIKVTTFVTEAEHLPRAIAVRSEFFDEPVPATTGVIVKGLMDPRMLVEIEVVAIAVDTQPRTQR
jgi:2-iminobutanoate/2-iminopropanoate deaminase